MCVLKVPLALRIHMEKMVLLGVFWSHFFGVLSGGMRK